MNELRIVVRRSFEVMLVAFLPLFGGGIAWALGNVLVFWLLLGPALVGLFRVALRAAREEEPEWNDLLAARADPVGAIVAGVLFVLPFLLWGLLVDVGLAFESAQYARDHDAVPQVPFAVSLALLVHFALHVQAFAELAERRCGVLEAFRASRARVDRSERGAGGLTPLAVHLGLAAALLLVVLLAVKLAGPHGVVGALITGLVGPAAIAVLASWRVVQAESSHRADAALPADGAGPHGGDASLPPGDDAGGRAAGRLAAAGEEPGQG